MEVKIIAYVLIGVFLGPTASLAVTPIFCLLRTIFYVPFIREKLRREAIAKGHVIEATLQKKYNVVDYTDLGNVGTEEDIGVYCYQYNVKQYKYQAVSKLSYKELPSTIMLYYIKNPRKATCAMDLENWEIPWLRFYIAISFIIAVTTVIVGLTVDL